MTDKTKIWLSSPHMGGDEESYVKEAFDTNWIAPLGPNVIEFENDLVNYNKGKAALALSSGTAAIHIAIDLLDVGPGDIVLVQSFTFCGTVNPVLYRGATPVFIDSEMDTWNMDPEALQQAINDIDKAGNLKKVKGIIPVHLYGMPAKIDEIIQISKKYGIPVIEDAAESLGSKFKDQYTGTFGWMGVYSFNGNKIITTSGGGALISDDKEGIEAAFHLSTQARDNAPHYQHTKVGYNYRMSNVLAGIGRGQMAVLDERINQRRANFEKYTRLFSRWENKGLNIEVQRESDDSFSNRWLTTILVDPSKNNGLDREKIRLSMEEENIECRPLWKPMHMQPVFAGYDFYSKEGKVADENGDKSVAGELFKIGLCLPSGSNLTEDDWNRIEDKFDSIFEEAFFVRS
jgi:dTDP-4-amino-4,6-dideoxygalactose transaminase